MADLPRLVRVAIKKLVPTYESEETDPNKMTEEQKAALEALIQRVGVITAITINKSYKIIDGHHRYWAALKLGITHVPVVMVSDSADQGEWEKISLGIGLNNIHGEFDHMLVGTALKDLLEDAMPIEDLALCTGFSQAEINDLVNALEDESEDLPDDAGGEPDDEEEKPRPFVLEIPFEAKEDYRLCRRKLRKAAGKGGDLSRGLLNVLGELDKEKKQ